MKISGSLFNRFTGAVLILIAIRDIYLIVFYQFDWRMFCEAWICGIIAYVALKERNFSGKDHKSQ